MRKIAIKAEFEAGEPRMFESRAQLAKRSAQYHPLDGQLVPRSSDAGLLAAIIAGEVPSCSDADWLADPKKRSNYTLGDGSTNIRMPDRNGKSVGAIGSVFARGDGKNSPAHGVIAESKNVEHSHSIIGSDKVFDRNSVGGAFVAEDQCFIIVGNKFNAATPPESFRCNNVRRRCINWQLWRNRVCSRINISSMGCKTLVSRSKS